MSDDQPTVGQLSGLTDTVVTPWLPDANHLIDSTTEMLLSSRGLKQSKQQADDAEL